jgi:hypothetical protein
MNINGYRSDKLAPNPHYRSAPPMRLYSVKRVLAIQNSPEFSECLRQEKARKEALIKRREDIQARRFQQFDRKYGSWTSALPDACEVLFNLNRHAKHDSCSDANRADIYDLKSEMVRLLYQHGYCTECFEHYHDLPEKLCFGCYGTGTDHNWESCRRCNGSGVFKQATTVMFVCFRFVVGGKSYCWHQPEDAVNFQFETTADSSAWQPEGSDEKPLALNKTKFAMAKDLLRWILARVRDTRAKAA